MTTRANLLTAGATRAPSDGGPKWSMPANSVRALVNALARLGYDSGSLRASAGLDDHDLDNPDARISCERVGALLSRAQQQRFTPNLGLEIARVTPLGAYPLLDYLVVTSDTAGEGIRQFARYCRLVGNPVTVAVREDIDPIHVVFSDAAASFSVEYTASLMILHLRNETHGRFAASSVSFIHQPDDPTAMERTLGCPVRTAESWNGISVPLEAWRLPLRRGDPVLRQVLESQGNEILARLPARNGLALQVQSALTRRVAGGDTGINALAREFAMSTRTLQRRLAAEGVSYQELCEDARKEAAGRHLDESSLTIAEVAYLIGYSEAAPFHRAFKRWYRMTPEEFRETRRTARSSGP